MHTFESPLCFIIYTVVWTPILLSVIWLENSPMHFSLKLPKYLFGKYAVLFRFAAWDQAMLCGRIKPIKPTSKFSCRFTIDCRVVTGHKGYISTSSGRRYSVRVLNSFHMEASFRIHDNLHDNIHYGVFQSHEDEHHNHTGYNSTVIWKLRIVWSLAVYLSGCTAYERSRSWREQAPRDELYYLVWTTNIWYRICRQWKSFEFKTLEGYYT